MGRARSEAVFSCACDGAVICDKADEMEIWLLGQLYCCLAVLMGGNNELVAVARDEAAGGVCLGWLGLPIVGDVEWLTGGREEI